MVRAQGGGAVASWWPSGFYRAVFTDGLRALGSATTQAKLSLWMETPGFGELIDTYLLFGDPAMELSVPQLLPYPAYMPLVLQGGERP